MRLLTWANWAQSRHPRNHSREAPEIGISCHSIAMESQMLVYSTTSPYSTF